MTHWLTKLLGRLPIGWLQLSHSKGRLAAAIAGVAFANVLVFVQLGIVGALEGTINATYTPFKADIIISSTDANTLTDGSPLHRRLLWRVLANPGVKAASPLYLGKVDWKLPNNTTASMTVYAFPSESEAFAGPILSDKFNSFTLLGHGLIDRQTRGIDNQVRERLLKAEVWEIEVNGKTLSINGSFELGGGFSSDGAFITSDQTFFTLFPSKMSGTPSHILINVATGMDITSVVKLIQSVLVDEPVKIRSMSQAKKEDNDYQTTQRPIGVIFGFGVFIGILVGLVIVYQVLSTDVADHIREYATFKAMGYSHSFIKGIVFEEAAILAIFGFIPGMIVSLMIYQGMSGATGLAVEMDITRAASVFIGTVLACAASGVFAARRLQSADPAERF